MAKEKIQKSKFKVPNYILKLKNYHPGKKIALIVLILGVILLVSFKKNWFIAATVNNLPITNLELQIRLNEQYRNQILDQLINEKIILDEARKNNIIISSNEIGSKISQIETNLGGAQILDTLLAQQGQSRNSLQKQLNLQLTIEKLYQREASVSAEEVEQFITQNKNQLKASDSAGQIKEAQQTLTQQKLTEIFNQKFQELKKKAKVIIF